MKKILPFIALCLLVYNTFTLFALDRRETYVWDTITFEKIYPYLNIDTSVQNCWQIGIPSKINFGSAHSGDKAILTDSINAYPTNNNSFIELRLGVFNINLFPHSIYMDFTHKYDTDTLKDGGYITVSYDNGNSWQNIVHEDDFGSQNNGSIAPLTDRFEIYSETDLLSNNEPGFSGNSNGWVKSTLAWYDIPCTTRSTNVLIAPDTLRVRFNFVSDSINNDKGGWMIDDIVLYSVMLGDAVELNEKNTFSFSPNPLSEISEIVYQSYDQLHLTAFDSGGKVIFNQTYFDNNKILLKKEQFESGIYFIQLKTESGKIMVKKLIVE